MAKKQSLAESLAHSYDFGYTNAIAEAIAKFDRMNTTYLRATEITVAADRINKIFEPLQALQKQFESYSSIAESIKNVSRSFEASGLAAQMARIQKVPFDNIATLLSSSVDKLKFVEFDLFDDIDFEEDIEKKASSSIITEVSQIKKIIKEIYLDNEFLYKITPRNFEEVIAELLYGRGFEVELTKQTRDNGYDIIAVNNINGFRNKYLIECKKHAPKRPIGIEIIRSFCDVIKEEKANKGVIFTTSYFSMPSIKRKEREGHLLDFKDRGDIIQWVKEYIE